MSEIIKSRKVRCIDTGVVYNSCAEAGRLLNICSTHISGCCLGNRKTVNKMKFEYILVDEIKDKRCSKCGLSIIGKECVPCKSLYNKEYREKNLERVNEQKKIWKRNFSKNNKERIKKEAKIYYLNNKEKIRIYHEAFYIKNKDKINFKNSQWRKLNKHKTRLYGHTYRVKSRCSGKLSSDIVEKLYKLQKGKCPCCKKQLGKDFEVDHIYPISLGGKNIDSNIQLLRKSCNRKKSNKDPFDYMQSCGYLL